MELRTRNVNTAFRNLTTVFHDSDRTSRDSGVAGRLPSWYPTVVRRGSRNGPVLMIDEPALIVYERPLERVLFNKARNASPFLHLYHSLWMLTGRNDVAPLAYYASNMANYSDDGRTLNGAYGYRWRRAKSQQLFDAGGDFEGDQFWESTVVDQLDILVSRLKADPTSRRAVLTMWNVEDDLLKIGESKDVCCNTAVYFSIREGWVDDSAPHAAMVEVMDGPPQYLDMTVTNRSNDMVWGMLGEDFVTFSVLQEYMAARLGVEVGRYTQFTNNLHVYESNWKPEEWLNEHETIHNEYRNIENGSELRLVPLVKDPTAFEKDLPEFVEAHSGTIEAGEMEDRWTEPFLSTVAGPLLLAFACHKERAYHDAFTAVDMIAADDWRIAARGWIERRRKSWEGKK